MFLEDHISEDFNSNGSLIRHASLWKSVNLVIGPKVWFCFVCLVCLFYFFGKVISLNSILHKIQNKTKQNKNKNKKKKKKKKPETETKANIWKNSVTNNVWQYQPASHRYTGLFTFSFALEWGGGGGGGGGDILSC